MIHSKGTKAPETDPNLQHHVLLFSKTFRVTVDGYFDNNFYSTYYLRTVRLGRTKYKPEMFHTART